MKTITFNIVSFSLFFVLLFFSCKEDTLSTRLLKQAQEQADTQPEKALQLLDSIKDPQKMDKEDYMKYIVARTQAKYRAKQDISEDTIIFEAQRYFDTKNNTKQSALAHFYVGLVYLKNIIYSQALKSFKEAEVYALKDNNSLLAARGHNNMGYIYYEQDLMDSAIVQYKLALDIYNNESETNFLKMQTIYSLGITYYAADDLVQADSSFTIGLNLAQQIDNQRYQSRFIQHIGMVYKEKGLYKQASNYLHAALNKTESSSDSLYIYLNLTQLYNYMNRPDSTQYYTEKMRTRLSEITDIYTLRNIYSSFSEHYKQEGNYNEAFRYADSVKVTEQNIKAENKTLELLEADKKFALEQQEKRLTQSKRETFLFYGGVIISLMLIGLLFLLSRRHVNKELSQLQQEIDRIKNLRNPRNN